MPRLVRITTVPISLHLLLPGQPRYMRQRGFDVHLASADGPEREAVMEAEGCPHHIVPMTRAITPVQDLRCLWQLIRLFRRLRPDIVHSHTPKAGLLAMMAARLTGVPVRLHTVAGLPLMTARGFRRRLLTWIERLTYACAGEVWPNSRSLYQYIKEEGLAPESKLSIISHGSSNGIDLKRWSPEALRADKLEAVKKEISYNPQAAYLLAIGRVVRDKGIAELLAAFQALLPSYPALRLLLAGPIERERPEEALPADMLGFIDGHAAITHLPWVEEPEYLMALADVFVHASYREGFPNVVLQAGAMGCPIVCSNIPGNIDIVEDGRTGLYFEVRDAGHLERQLRFALENGEAMQEMAIRLRREVEQYYRREAVWEEIFIRYGELLRREGFTKKVVQVHHPLYPPQGGQQSSNEK